MDDEPAQGMRRRAKFIFTYCLPLLFLDPLPSTPKAKRVKKKRAVSEPNGTPILPAISRTAAITDNVPPPSPMAQHVNHILASYYKGRAINLVTTTRKAKAARAKPRSPSHSPVPPSARTRSPIVIEEEIVEDRPKKKKRTKKKKAERAHEDGNTAEAEVEENEPPKKRKKKKTKLQSSPKEDSVIPAPEFEAEIALSPSIPSEHAASPLASPGAVAAPLAVAKPSLPQPPTPRSRASSSSSSSTPGAPSSPNASHTDPTTINLEALLRPSQDQSRRARASLAALLQRSEKELEQEEKSTSSDESEGSRTRDRSTTPSDIIRSRRRKGRALVSQGYASASEDDSSTEALPTSSALVMAKPSISEMTIAAVPIVEATPSRESTVAPGPPKSPQPEEGAPTESEDDDNDGAITADEQDEPEATVEQTINAGAESIADQFENGDQGIPTFVLSKVLTLTTIPCLSSYYPTGTTRG